MNDDERTARDDDRVTLLTVGHGTLAAEDFATLLRDAGIEVLVDVRSYPGSRRNPQFGREAMERWVPEHGIEYHWEPRLGGRRRARETSRHVGLRHEAFRAYADHMEHPDFRDALHEVLATAATRRTAVMCSESVWWRCHRRLIADAATLVHDVDVLHVFHDHRLRPHAVTPGARRDDDGVVYDDARDDRDGGAGGEGNPDQGRLW